MKNTKGSRQGTWAWRCFLHGGEHVVAHVRPSVVVEVYNVCNDTRCLTEVGGAFRVIKPFGLEDAVHSFCDDVVHELVVFGHTDSRVDLVEPRDVDIVAILRATV